MVFIYRRLIVAARQAHGAWQKRRAAGLALLIDAAASPP